MTMESAQSVARSAQTAPIEVDVSAPVPVAFTGIRRTLEALKAVAPQIVQQHESRSPAEWNRFFPGSRGDAPDISDLALSPSERRLHRESEQVFRLLNFAARVILDVLAETQRPLVIRHAGACDLVSLRGLMRAVEWGRMEKLDGLIRFEDWNRRPAYGSRLFEDRRHAYLQTLGERMRLEIPSDAGSHTLPGALPAPVDHESRYLLEVLSPNSSAERRVAASVLALRSCFFTTNYDGALLAAETGLEVIAAAGGSFDAGAVESAWDELDTGFTTPAIEIDRGSLGDAPTLQALLLRSIGVVHVFTGEHDAALGAFAAGLTYNIDPERQAQLRMYRALTMIKRLALIPAAQEEIRQGLAGLEGRPGETPSLHEGWLRNVYALSYFQQKQLVAALDQEKKAIKAVGNLHDASATHLKINLISNVSVLHETAKQYDDAISTWRRFEKISASWGENFTKHHRYRLAGLQLAGGDRDNAIENYTAAYEAAGRLKDDLHQQVISAELGRLFLEGQNRETGGEWYERSVAHARTVGEPVALAESLVGRSLALKRPAPAEAHEALACSSSFPAQVEKLSAAIKGTDDALTLSVLPKPRSKLNRPFDIVNL